MDTDRKDANLNGKTFPDQVSLFRSYGYQLGPEIGKGSYATVKLATKSRTQQYFAVKMVPKYEVPKDFVSKFLPRELDVIKKLRHQHLVKFFQAIETNRSVYIILEFVENGSLLDRIRQDQHIEEKRSKVWFKQLVDVIDFCHKQGVVHRDIKCENILLDAAYNVKLTDFGFARANIFPKEDGSTPVSETYCGSYAYASPEIIKGVPYDPILADIWSMGVVLYAMLFGKLPFEATSAPKLLKQMEDKLTIPRSPVVSRSVRRLLTFLLTSSRFRLPMALLREDPWLTENSDEEKSKSMKIQNMEPLQAIGQD